MHRILGVLSLQGRQGTFCSNRSIRPIAPNAQFYASKSVKHGRGRGISLTLSRLLGLSKCVPQVAQTLYSFKWLKYFCDPDTQIMPSPSSQPWHTTRCCVLRWCCSSFSHVTPSNPHSSHRWWLEESSKCCSKACFEVNGRAHREQYALLFDLLVLQDSSLGQYSHPITNASIPLRRGRFWVWLFSSKTVSLVSTPFWQTPTLCPARVLPLHYSCDDWSVLRRIPLYGIQASHVTTVQSHNSKTVLLRHAYMPARCHI